MKIERRKFYTWKDNTYCSFMIKILQRLEPRLYEKDDIILKDQDEVEEIIFVQKGEVIIEAI